MQSFILPGFYEKKHVNKYLLDRYNDTPNIFLENIKLECFFGTFHFCAWNGGRIFYNYERAFFEDIEEIVEYYHNKNIPIRLTFTNQLITQEILKDPYCNLVCSLVNKYENQILINSSILKKYIQENFQNLKICSSTTKCLLNLEDIKNEINDTSYHQICLDYNINKNIEFLKSLSEQQKNKIELLCNAICMSNCPSRKEHYYLNDVSNLNLNSPYMINCYIDQNTLHPTTCNYINNISPKDIKEIYEPMGLSHFKLEGRTLNDKELLCNYARYLIKPEYQLSFIADF